jgi:hypothetical protein
MGLYLPLPLPLMLIAGPSDSQCAGSPVWLSRAGLTGGKMS